MNGGNTSLEMIFAQLFSSSGLFEMSDSARQQRLVPTASLLLGQQKKIALAVHAGLEARGLEVEEGEKCVHFR